MKFRRVIQMPNRSSQGFIEAKRRIIFEIEAPTAISAGIQATEMIRSLWAGWQDDKEWTKLFEEMQTNEKQK